MAVAGPGLTREGRRAIAVGAFLAIFVGSLLLLADGVGVLAKLALALPLVVVGLAAGLAVARPADGWTAARDQRHQRVPARRAAWPPPPFARLPIRRRFRQDPAPERGPTPSAGAGGPRGVWYFLPLLPVCLLAVLLLAIDGDLFGPIKAGAADLDGRADRARRGGPGPRPAPRRRDAPDAPAGWCWRRGAAQMTGRST